MQIERPLDTDVIIMRVEKFLSGVPADFSQLQEKIKVRPHLAGGSEFIEFVLRLDHVKTDAFVMRPLKAAGGDQPRHEINGAKFLQKRRVEGDFVNSPHDFSCRGRSVLAFDRIDLDEDDVGGLCFGEKRKQNGIAHIAAVPIRNRRRSRRRERGLAGMRRP